jgi:hypothetical protein
MELSSRWHYLNIQNLRNCQKSGRKVGEGEGKRKNANDIVRNVWLIADKDFFVFSPSFSLLRFSRFLLCRFALFNTFKKGIRSVSLAASCSALQFKCSKWKVTWIWHLKMLRSLLARSHHSFLHGSLLYSFPSRDDAFEHKGAMKA